MRCVSYPLVRGRAEIRLDLWYRSEMCFVCDRNSIIKDINIVHSNTLMMRVSIAEIKNLLPWDGVKSIHR